MLLFFLACVDADSADKSQTPAVDADGDGATTELDCDDADAAIHPGAPENCDGIDADCDGEVDEDPVDGAVWYADLDADGFGDPAAERLACEKPTDAVANPDDCDDTRADAHPTGTEVCGDAVDQDCDGELDEGCGLGGYVRTGQAFGDLAFGDDVVAMGVTDLDGDGVLDVVLSGDGVVAAQFGLAMPGRPTLDRLIESEVEGLGAALAAGDLDADGVTDLVVADRSGDGRAEIYDGGARTLGAPWASLSADVIGYASSLGVADLDGDGHDDLLIGTKDESPSGVFGIVQGPIGAGEHTTFDTRFAGTSPGDAAGYQVAVVGDTDGDGMLDLLAGGYGYAEDGQSGRAWLVTGPISAGSFSLADAATTFVSGTSGAVGMSVAGAGDPDGDGYDDLLIGGPRTDGDDGATYVGTAWVIRGPTPAGAMPLTDADVAISGTEAEDLCGWTLAGGGDVNADGRPDVAMMCGVNASEPKVALFFGPVADGAYTYDAADVTFAGEPGFGAEILLPPDLTGDGIDDLLLLESSEEHVWLLAGDATP